MMSASKQVQIRPATPTDAPALSTLATRIWLATYGTSTTQDFVQDFVSTSYSPSALERDISDKNKSIYLSYSSREGQEVLTGYVQLTRGTTDPCLAMYQPVDAQIELQRLYVAPDEQGKGIGKALMEHAEEVARQEGRKYLWLGVWEKAPWAQGVYLAAGFGKVGEHGFKVGGEVHTDWVMVKELR